MEVAKLVLDFTRVLLSWPGVTLLLGTLFLLRYQRPLADLLARIKSASGPGFSLLAADPATQQKLQENEAAEPAHKLLPGGESVGSPAMESSEIIKLRKKALFERWLNILFGTQLVLLAFIYDAGPEGVPEDTLRAAHERHRSLVGAGTPRDFERYIGFLTVVRLIERKSPDGARIGPVGREFVEYIRREWGVPPFRPF